MNLTNEENSEKVWSKKPTSYILNNYFIHQYKEEYESVKFIKQHLSKLSFNSLIDFGCGSGSLIYFLNQIINVDFTGIDICEETLNIAKQNNPDCIFIHKNITELTNNYDLTISNQTLLILSPDKQTNFINKQFEFSNKYVVFFSLFTDSKLTIDIKIHDPYNNEIVFYNIIPIDKIQNIADKFNFKVKIIEDFNISKNLDKPKQKGRGTYTIETKDNKLLQFSDVIYMPWKIIICEKICN